MQTQHLEVIPRIIDESIAANYQKPSSAPIPLTQSKETKSSTTEIAVAIPTFTQRFFGALKDYIIPVLFVLLVIVIIYILWKYFTKYRNRQDSDVPAIESLVDQPELSKYIFDITDSSDDDIRSKLSMIEEESGDNETSEDDEKSGGGEESDLNEDSESESSDVESNTEEVEENDSLPSLITEPDFDAIANLINQPIEEYLSDENPPTRFEYISPTPEVSDNDSDQESSPDCESSTNLNDSMLMLELPKPKSRKPRKPKRIVM